MPESDPLRVAVRVSEAQIPTAYFPIFQRVNRASPAIAEQGYLSYFASSMRTGLATTNGNVSIFSPDILAHVESIDQTLYVTPQSFPNGRLTLQQVMSKWYQAPCTVQREIGN